MRRREFIAVVGSAAATCSFTAQVERIRRIGVIMGFAEDDQVWQSYLAIFKQRLQDFGWSEGRNVRFNYRFTGESSERIRAAATEVVATACRSMLEQAIEICDGLRLVLMQLAEPRQRLEFLREAELLEKTAGF